MGVTRGRRRAQWRKILVLLLVTEANMDWIGILRRVECGRRIKELLENYVKPAVEMDGGAIQFKSYNDGVVNLMLQGSCSGCPSSMITLKAGIEGMMKRMIPEVSEVVAEAE